jgi:hypothetical protein
MLCDTGFLHQGASGHDYELQQQILARTASLHHEQHEGHVVEGYRTLHS